jgi:hypothetical protein
MAKSQSHPFDAGISDLMGTLDENLRSVRNPVLLSLKELLLFNVGAYPETVLVVTMDPHHARPRVNERVALASSGGVVVTSIMSQGSK